MYAYIMDSFSNSSAATTTDSSSNPKSRRRRGFVRKRPVSFGISRNYHGNVYTIPGDNHHHHEADGIDINVNVEKALLSTTSTNP